MKSLFKNNVPQYFDYSLSFAWSKSASLLIFMILGVLVISCDSNRLYEKNKDVDKGSWSMTDTACFDVDITDTLTLNNFYINLRHSTTYKYSNIFLFFHTTFPNGYVTSDTLQILLADNTGKWIGTGLGEIKECRVLLKDRVQFPNSGTYFFCIEQAMRTEYLDGVEDIGIRIERIE